MSVILEVVAGVVGVGLLVVGAFMLFRWRERWALEQALLVPSKAYKCARCNKYHQLYKSTKSLDSIDKTRKFTADCRRCGANNAFAIDVQLRRDGLYVIETLPLKVKFTCHACTKTNEFSPELKEVPTCAVCMGSCSEAVEDAED